MTTAEVDSMVWLELWTSLASLLRSYTSAHGLNRKEQATVELGAEHITVRAAARWLRLKRDGQMVYWMREDQTGGKMQLTIEGRLRDESGNEEEMDLQAEAWARELMQ